MGDLANKLTLFYTLNIETCLPEVLLTKHNSYSDMQMFIVEQIMKNNFCKNCINSYISFLTVCVEYRVDIFL